MNKIIFAAAALALMTSAPAFAKTHTKAHAAHAQVAPRAALSSTAVYNEQGRYVGADPDANVRLQLLRDTGGY